MKKHRIEKAFVRFFVGCLWNPLNKKFVYKFTLWNGDRYLFYYVTDVKKWVWGDKCKNT